MMQLELLDKQDVMNLSLILRGVVKYPSEWDEDTVELAIRLREQLN